MKSSARKMETVSQYLNWARSEGFDLDFVVRDDRLEAAGENAGEKKKYSAKDAKIVGFLRFEGESDPGDSCIAYMIETGDGRKGTLVDAYGTYADQKVSKFMQDMYQEIKYNPEVQNGNAA